MPDLSDFKAPFLKYDDIRIHAENFLNIHVTDNSLPVDIDEIVDNKLEIDVIPIHGLKLGFDVESYISSDFKSIYIDRYLYDNYENRYKYSLAHEIGHSILHKELYEGLDYDSTDEWKDIIKSIPDKEYSFIESHAYNFAGLILVPDFALEDRFKEAISKVEASGYNVEDFNKTTLTEWIARYLCDEFKVSSAVIEKRLRFNDLSV